MDVQRNHEKKKKLSIICNRLIEWINVSNSRFSVSRDEGSFSLRKIINLLEAKLLVYLKKYCTINVQIMEDLKSE